MNVDRPALVALVLFGLLGLGFAVVALGLNRNPAAAPPKKAEPENKGPELAPPPRVVETVSRMLKPLPAFVQFPVDSEIALGDCHRDIGRRQSVFHEPFVRDIDAHPPAHFAAQAKFRTIADESRLHKFGFA